MNRLKRKNADDLYVRICFYSQLFFTFIFTVNLLYFVKTVELNPFQLVLIGSVLELSVFLSEIPTGILSDVKSRKISIIIGYFLIGLGFLIEGSFPFFLPIIFAQIVWGLGYSFTSGSLQAWIADEMGEDHISNVFIRGAKADKLGQIIAIPLSIGIGFMMINLPIIIGGFSMIGLAIYLILFMQEDHFKPQNLTDQGSVWDVMKKNVSNIYIYTKTSDLLKLLLFIALIVGFYSEGFDRLWISHFMEMANLSGFSDEKLVFLVGGIQFIVVLVSFIALNYINRSTIHQNLRQIYISLFLGCMIIIGSLIGFALSTYIIGLLIFYVMIQVARQVMHPLEDIWLNTIIPESSTRATFFSVKGQLDAVGQISGAPVIGFIASSFSIKFAIIISAILLTPALFIYRIILRKYRN